MNTNSFLSFLIASLLITLNMVQAASLYKYTGNWKLTEAVTSDDSTLSLPERLISCILSDGDDNDSLHISVKIGNSFRGKVNILSSEADDQLSVNVGYLMSTRMMSPEPYNSIEQFFQQAITEVNVFKLSDDDTTLTFQTSEEAPKLVFSKIE
eukprot:Nitzschia sp. Nitz4//scaffold301_size22573//1979//2437//NITZ4_008548-RA/size22573-processed-gene-0.23-mRNA-1//-1//CDS//3329546998//8221//frame0